MAVRILRAAAESRGPGQAVTYGKFDKAEILEIRKTVDDLFEGIPKSKRMGYLGHLNDIMIFLSECDKVARPEKNDEKPKTE